MLTEFAGLKVIYRDVWDLQSKLKTHLAALQKERDTHEEEIGQIRKQEKAIRHFLGQHGAPANARSAEASHAA